MDVHRSDRQRARGALRELLDAYPQMVSHPAALRDPFFEEVWPHLDEPTQRYFAWWGAEKLLKEICKTAEQFLATARVTLDFGQQHGWPRYARHLQTHFRKNARVYVPSRGGHWAIWEIGPEEKEEAAKLLDRQSELCAERAWALRECARLERQHAPGRGTARAPTAAPVPAP